MTFAQDLRYSLRVLRRAPLLATVIVATLGLGIGANTAIYSLVKATVLRPAPFDDPGQLAAVWTHYIGSPYLRGPSSSPDVLDWREHSAVFEDFGYYFPRRTYNLTSPGAEPRRIVGGRMSAPLLNVLRVNPILGRPFLPEEDVQGARTVAMLSHKLWLGQFGGDREIIGKSVRLDQVPYEIVGVLPPDFHLTSPDPELWVPFSQEGAVESYGRRIVWLNAVGRLKPGLTVEQAAAALEVISANSRELYPETNERRGVFVEPLSEALASDKAQILFLIWIGAGFVLLIACVNVASLMLGKAASRRNEVAIRAALGASRGRLVRQFLTESVLLAFLGGLAGLGLAALQLGPLLSLLSRTFWTDLPLYLQQVSIDAYALAFAGITTVATGLLFGILPALVQSQASLAGSISGRGVPRGGTPLLRSALVAAQIALSMILLVGVGLSASALLRAESNEPGFALENLAVLEIELPRTQYAVSGRMEAGRRIWRVLPAVEAAGQSLRERLAAIPGVTEVGLASLAPPKCCRATRVEVPDANSANLDGRYYDFQTVSPTYFEALGIPIVQGRAFSASESSASVIVNDAFVREFFGDQSALGQTAIIHGWKAGLRNVAVIVGVVGDSLISPWQIEGARPQIYLPYSGQPEETPGNMRDDRLTLSYLIRTDVSPATIFAEAKRAVAAALPDLPITRLGTLESAFESLLGPAQTMARLLGGLALLAILLTAIGIYGVVAHSVSVRKKEFGVKLALGEDRSRLLVSVLASTWRLATCGIALGAAGAFALVRVMDNQIFRVEEDRLEVFAAMVLVLLLVATAASLLPSWRASGLEPISVLRED